jgi:cell shape-determining protein MreD
MIKKILILIMILYFLILFQTSFLVHFPVFNKIILILILVILINLFERPKDYFGIFSAFLAGFFLDIFSSKFIGYHILIFLSISIFLKFILSYVRFPFFKKV